MCSPKGPRAKATQALLRELEFVDLIMGRFPDGCGILKWVWYSEVELVHG